MAALLCAARLPNSNRAFWTSRAQLLSHGSTCNAWYMAKPRVVQMTYHLPDVAVDRELAAPV